MNNIVLEYNITTERMNTSPQEEIKKAFHLRTKQYRTIKIIYKKKLCNRRILKIKEEIDLLGEMDHPHILKMYEYFEDKRFFYIVFEDTQRENLHDYIRRRDILSQEEVCDIFYNLLEALSYLHSRKVIHKCINPCNILMQENKVKLSNFSFAVVGCADEEFKYILESNSKYVAPEMLNFDVSEKSDLWSAGLVLFFILTRDNLFNFNSPEENHYSILYDEINFQSFEFKCRIS